MALLGDDCYFFCTSTCSKGAACPFRHVEAAKTCRIICQHWQMGGCFRPMCKFRHSDFVLQLNTSEVPCYWESQPAGCVKKNCPYKHSKPRPQEDASTANADNSPLSNNESVTSQSFVQPVVTPVIIQPSVESEESNSSPVKKQQEVTSVVQESKTQIDSKIQEMELSTPETNNENSRLANAPQKHTIKKKATKMKTKINKSVALKKKGQKKIVGKCTGKVTPKAKKIIDQPQKNVKERLGKLPSPQPAVNSSKSGSESNADSDDSIENIKVMSMEEIFRQKALESMLKKRVAEGKAVNSARERKTLHQFTERKTLTPATEKKSAPTKLVRKTPATKETRLFPTAKRKTLPLDKKHSTGVKKTIRAPVSKESSSSSEEETADESDSTQQSSGESSTGSSDTSDSSSADSDENSSDDSEDIDVRRVVVDLESEKAARKKAKESLKKQRLNVTKAQGSKNKRNIVKPTVRQLNQMPLSALNKLNNRNQQPKKRRVNVDYDSDDIVSSRMDKPLKLSVRDRLGKSTALHKASSDARLLSRAEKFRSVIGVSKPVLKKVDTSHQQSKRSSSEDDHDTLDDVKVKTLEEIKLEKMRKLAAGKRDGKVSSQESETGFHRPLSVKQRLGNISDDKRNREVELSLKQRLGIMSDEKQNRDVELPMKQRLGNISDEKQNREVELPIKQRLGNFSNEKQIREVELPIKQRFDIVPEKKQNEIENMKGRQVVLVNDSGSKSDDASHLNPSDEQKKAKKRRWRSQRRNVDLLVETNTKDERTTIVASPLADGNDYEAEQNFYKEEGDIEESPFESLRRRALIKKLHTKESRKLKTSASNNEVTSVKADLETSSYVGQVEEDGTDAKIHKHKHNHKHHKKIKIERQIYMPPAMKNTTTVSKPLTPENLSPKREMVTAPTAKVSPQKREPHPIAAAWAAGLSLSSKGTSVRRPESLSSAAESSGIVGKPVIGERLGIREIAKSKEIISGKPEISERLGIREIAKSKEIISSDKTSEPSVASSGVTIKSFSEIMAEKRKRRLEMQAQKSGTTDLSASAVSETSSFGSSPAQAMPATISHLSSTSSKAVDAKPRVPISPIVFLSNNSSGNALIQKDNPVNSSQKATLQTSVATHRKVSPDVPNPSNFSATSMVTAVQIPSASHNVTTFVGQKVRPVKKNSINNGDKKKKVKKLFTKKNFKEDIDRNCLASSEDSNSNMLSSHSLYTVTSIPSETVTSVVTDTSSQDMSSQSTWSSKASIASSSQLFQNSATTEVPNSSHKLNVSKFSTKIDNPNVKTHLPDKHSIPATKVDSEPTKKKNRLSIDDEFNFFEDEFLDVDDAIISDTIEPIDDLLQDIDELLS